ncbi:MAG: tetratricopeptide repeat protein [Burkholderiaceae bacterium]|nr:tetratricopeptide repeat protein [Burkholderiaceae bacterium]
MHARAPGDAATSQELARAYEELGEPEKALALLRPVLAEPARTPARRARLELLAALAERTGDIATQRAALQALLGDDEAAPAIALRLAALEYGRGDERAAYAALLVALPRAEGDVKGHLEFWSAYADLARTSGRRDDALRAYRLLIDSGAATDEVLINTAALIEDNDPREAARLYDLAWRRSGRADLAAQALYLLLRAGDAAQVRSWLANQTPAQRTLLERDARFLMQRATIHLADGQVRAAVADARRASALQPNDASIEALLVWTLIAARDAPALRAQLTASTHANGDEPQLWGPFAAGWLALQEPRRAIRFLRLQAGSGGDPLWTLSYADALEQLGQRDLAWSLRRHAWLRHGQASKSAPGPAERLDVQRRIVPLAATLVGGDAARAQLQALLAADPQAGTSATREAALAYWIARERSDIVAAWLLGQYADMRARPAWAELSVALAHDDAARVETLLDTVADWLPAYDRIEAADRVGRTAQAQTFAFDTLAALPDSDELHRRLVDRVAGERSATAPQFAGAGLRDFSQRPIEETTWTADGSVLLSPRVRLGAALAQSTRSSSDTAQLVDPPRHDTTAQLELGYDLGIDRGLRLALSQRDGLAREPGWRLQGDWRAADRLSVAATIGQGQPTTDNAYLRVGAVRDLASLSLTSRFAQREFAALTVEASRFDAQGGGRIGDGQVIRLEAGHYLRTEYPDLSLRLSAADLRYTPAPGVASALLPLLPEAARATATNAQLLPQSTQQVGAALVFGETARERYTRAWRPFGVLGVNNDRLSGTDYAWTLGATGSVLGGDELSLFVAAGSGLGVQVVPFRSYGLRYRWLF